MSAETRLLAAGWAPPPMYPPCRDCGRRFRQVVIGRPRLYCTDCRPPNLHRSPRRDSAAAARRSRASETPLQADRRRAANAWRMRDRRARQRAITTMEARP